MIIRQDKAKTLSALLAGLGVGLFPTLSFGLGLGDIQIESRLNQRLHARIEVVDVSDEEWQQIRARIAPRTLLSEASVHPELLESLNLRAIEDANHRHYIEVTSTDVLTEPLFDLPVAVAGSSVQVVRNYSVLLDPASTQDAPQSAPAVMLAQQTADTHSVGSTAAAASAAVAHAHVSARKGGSRHHRSHLARRHSSASPKVAATTNKPAVVAKEPSAAQPAAIQTASTQDTQQLEGQLATLQQMLTKMQSTIAAQDAEIAKLTAQVAARTESQEARKVPAPAAQPAASTESEVSDEGASPVRPRGFLSIHPLAYRLAGVVGGMVVLVLGAVALLRRRQSVFSREIHARDSSARKETPSGEEPKSDVLAWQSSLRDAQSGTWRSPMKSSDSGMDESETIVVEEAHADSDSTGERPAVQSMAADSEVTTVSSTVGMNELTANLEADLEALSASYESEHVHTMTGVVNEWRAQKEMLERDYLSDTEALPFVLDEGNKAKSSGEEPTEEQPMPANRGSGEDTVVADISSAHSAKNGDVAEILDLLNKLAAAREHLSPAQLLHLETLQRSLREGKSDLSSDFVTHVAI